MKETDYCRNSWNRNTANPDERDSVQYPLEGCKYFGGATMYLILKDVVRFLVFYTPQGGAELSDRVLVERY